ncbi:hypothetical protein AMTRI_Chr05g69710 [Amborella trichopoda]
MPKEEAWTNFPRDLMVGAVMGGMVHTIVAPIERAKLLLQTQESNLAITGGKHRRFKGMFDCIIRTFREEGVLSLWRGNGSSVLRYYPSVALNFSLKNLGYRWGGRRKVGSSHHVIRKCLLYRRVLSCQVSNHQSRVWRLLNPEAFKSEAQEILGGLTFNRVPVAKKVRLREIFEQFLIFGLEGY